MPSPFSRHGPVTSRARRSSRTSTIASSPTFAEKLQANLPPPYYAALGRRVWIEAARRSIGPDVHVASLRADVPEPGPAAPRRAAGRSARLPRVASRRGHASCTTSFASLSSRSTPRRRRRQAAR